VANRKCKMSDEGSRTNGNYQELQGTFRENYTSAISKVSKTKHYKPNKGYARSFAQAAYIITGVIASIYSVAV
jgi:hypothetical protein